MVLLHLLSNIDITNYFDYEPRFDGVFSKKNSSRIKHGAFLINLDDKKSKGRHWVTLLIDRNKVVYFLSFETQYILQEILNKDKSITHSIFRIPNDDSILCGFYCMALIEYMLAGKALLDYTNLISPNDYKKNDKIIYKYFKDKYVKS